MEVAVAVVVMTNMNRMMIVWILTVVLNVFKKDVMVVGVLTTLISHVHVLVVINKNLCPHAHQNLHVLACVVVMDVKVQHVLKEINVTVRHHVRTILI